MDFKQIISRLYDLFRKHFANQLLSTQLHWIILQSINSDLVYEQSDTKFYADIFNATIDLYLLIVAW